MAWYRSSINQNKPVAENGYDYVLRGSNPNVYCFRDMSNIFRNGGNYGRSFNMPVIIGNAITNCSHMFENCRSFDSPVTMGTGIIDYSNMFNNCPIFNKPLSVYGSNINCRLMFWGCYYFNSPISWDVKDFLDCAWMFANCRNFNQPIPSIVGNRNNLICYHMFENCHNFNQPVIIDVGNRANCYQMFINCYDFNQPVVIGSNVMNMVQMFVTCSVFNSDIYIKGNEYRTINVSGIGLTRNLSIHFNHVLNNRFNTGTFSGRTLNWITQENMYYNSEYNIYCYYNYDGVTDPF